MKLSLPVLLTGLVVGLVISILQVATQLQEQTLTFVPKIIAVGIVLFLLAPWLTREIVEYTEYIFASLFKILR